MLDYQMPIAAQTLEFRTGAEVAVAMSTRAVRDLWQVAGWGDFNDQLGQILPHLPLEGFGDFLTAGRGQSGECMAWRIAPDKVLLENAGSLTRFQSDDVMVPDLSHARVAMTLSGARARDVLTQVIAIDTAPDAFTEGRFVQTGIHQVGVLIQCVGADAFDIYVPVTWAASVWEVLAINARSYGEPSGNG